MKSSDKMRQLFDRAAVQANAAPDGAVFERIEAAYTKTVQHKLAPHRPSIWRFAMRSPMMKLAVAAVLVIACLMGMVMWKGTGSSVALANVLTRLERTAAYAYHVSATVTNVPAGASKAVNTQLAFTTRQEATVLTAQNLGLRITTDRTGPNGGATVRQLTYVLPQKRIMLTLVPDQKRYAQVEIDDRLLDQYRKQNNDPRAMVEQILSGNYTNLGRSTIDGVQVEGFETIDAGNDGKVTARVDVKMWIDVKTQLPVRGETDMRIDQMHMHYIVDNFQWGLSVDPREFEPTIPADYTRAGGGLPHPDASHK